MTRRKDMQVNDRLLGLSAKNGATDICSICGQQIPEDEVPLMLWNSGGKTMWVYCELHGDMVLHALRPAR